MLNWFATVLHQVCVFVDCDALPALSVALRITHCPAQYTKVPSLFYDHTPCSSGPNLNRRNCAVVSSLLHDHRNVEGQQLYTCACCAGLWAVAVDPLLVTWLPTTVQLCMPMLSTLRLSRCVRIQFVLRFS